MLLEVLEYFNYPIPWWILHFRKIFFFRIFDDENERRKFALCSHSWCRYISQSTSGAKQVLGREIFCLQITGRKLNKILHYKCRGADIDKKTICWNSIWWWTPSHGKHHVFRSAAKKLQIPSDNPVSRANTSKIYYAKTTWTLCFSFRLLLAGAARAVALDPIHNFPYIPMGF